MVTVMEVDMEEMTIIHIQVDTEMIMAVVTEIHIQTVMAAVMVNYD